MAKLNMPNPYLKTQVETASKEQLVVMLFDGIVRFSEQARKAILNNEIEDMHHNLMRAQAIIMELIYTVDRDKGGEVAKNLLGLHAYAFNCLIHANMKKDTSKIDEVQKIYRELRDGWVGAMQSLGLALNTNSPASASPAPNAAQPQQPAQTIKPPVAAAMPTPAAAAAPAPAPIPAKPMGYGPGRTALPQATIPPKAAGQATMVSQQQQRSSQMLSAYSNNNRNTA